MLTLALDVDGVLLDSERNGEGHWSKELMPRFGMSQHDIGEAFFDPCWDDIIHGRRSVEDGLAEALSYLNSTADVESILSCWFETDYVPFEATFDLARRAGQNGCRVVLATNQEHRRADYLQQRIGSAINLDHVFYSAEIGHKKNDERFFAKASNHLGLSGDELHNVIFVDDTAANIETARGFGWRAFHAMPGAQWQHEVGQLLGLSG